MKFFQLIPPDTNFNFVGKFKYFMVFSIVMAVVILAGLATRGLNYGIDFTGGTVVQVKFKKPTPSENVRKIVEDLGEKDASVVALGNQGDEYLITARTAEEIPGQIPFNRKLIQKLGNEVTIQRVDTVGPKVGRDLKFAALQSLIYSVLLIAIYIWFRFDFRSAPGATIAMLHDLVMITGFYLITGREFTITAVAALLTIAGYSVNDTIVVYDRIREILRTGSGTSATLPQIINTAINVTLSRTVLTASVTLVSVVPIVFLCTGEIQSFALAMLIGIFVGTYSTVFIASPFTIVVQRFLDLRAARKAA